MKEIIFIANMNIGICMEGKRYTAIIKEIIKYTLLCFK